MEKIHKKVSSLFNAVYDVGVIIKGIDGLAELVAGLALLISPQLVHKTLQLIIGRVNHEHTHVHHLIAVYVARLDDQIAASGLVFLIIFLLSHGIIKLALVYCLLKRIVKAYPIALLVLTGFLIFQLYVFINEPTFGMALFSVMDAVIIGLVWHEYRVLSAEKVV